MRSAEIPFGTTISYAELARRVSNEAAVRAVGAANGRNPIPIIVPCHRVIGSDGSLTGFGGGLASEAVAPHDTKERRENSTSRGQSWIKGVRVV